LIFHGKTFARKRGFEKENLIIQTIQLFADQHFFEYKFFLKFYKIQSLSGKIDLT